MSSLRQNLQAQRTAETPVSSVTAEERQAALLIFLWQGASWVLPWAQFLSARLAGDRLELTFAHTAVTVTGQNLTGLLDDVAAFRLSCLRDLPADYGRKSGEGQPFISRIEVRSSSPESRDSPG